MNTVTHPSYRPSTTIQCSTNGEGWRVTRKMGADRFRLYGHWNTLGEVGAMIRKAHRACSSRWRIDGIEVSGDASTYEMATHLEEVT